MKKENPISEINDKSALEAAILALTENKPSNRAQERHLGLEREDTESFQKKWSSSSERKIDQGEGHNAPVTQMTKG